MAMVESTFIGITNFACSSLAMFFGLFLGIAIKKIEKDGYLMLIPVIGFAVILILTLVLQYQFNIMI